MLWFLIVSQPSGKSSKKDPNQKDLRTFFTSGTFEPETRTSTTLDSQVGGSSDSDPSRNRLAAKSDQTDKTIILDDSSDDVSELDEGSHNTLIEGLFVCLFVCLFVL